MLIKIPNLELYREWLRWYEWKHPEFPSYTQRTYSFIKSNEGIYPIWR